MDKGSSASWEQVHRILFPGGPVPASLINSNATVVNSGAGILGPGPAPTPFINTPSTSSPAGPFVIQNSPHVPPPPPSHLLNKDRKDEGSHFGPPPPAPRDPKTLYYIKLFAAFVSKFGREYEAVVRTKQHGKPEFGFLFGAPPGSEAGLGNRYYEWQKDVLVKVSEAKKAVSEGNMPPDRLKSMQRELEKHMNGGQTLKDLRIESILGLPDHKLDWQKIAWEVGVALPGKRTSQVETLDKEKMKAPTNKADGEACVDPSRDWKQLNKADRARRKDDHDSGEEFSPGGRRRRKRSRSPSPGRQRYRSRSPRSPRRSPAARSSSPSRRRGRSYSRSPPRRRTSPPPRRAAERKRDGDERREEKQVQEPVESSPFPNKPHVLLPPPRLQPLVASQDHAAGFIAAENSFMMFPQASLQLQPLPDSGLVRVPPGYPQVGVAFPPALPDIPVQQQQFLLQQLQLSQLAAAAAQPGPLTNTWPSSDVQHVLVSPVPLPLFDPPAQQLQLQQHQHQPQIQQLVAQPEKSPSNDVEMEVVSTSVKAEAPEVVVTSNGKATEDSSASKSKDKDKDDETSRTNEKRALKIVRNTVADFVKELLNPKWRDGILSKDDFKVIAQKAVNKVVGNLQGSQIPKGPDRLDRFMSSSKEKITKLVQEYVEKHTKNAPVPVPAPATAPS